MILDIFAFSLKKMILDILTISQIFCHCICCWKKVWIYLYVSCDFYVEIEEIIKISLITSSVPYYLSF